MHERKSKPDYLENWQFETPKASTLKVATTDRELIALYESGESLIGLQGGDLYKSLGGNGVAGLETDGVNTIGLKLDLTPAENLEFWSSLYGTSQTSPADALIQVGLKDQAHIACRYLSAGQRRRAAIARFQINGALIWILDEPLTALDSSGIQSVCQTIDAHLDRGGLVVLTSHQPITLERHAVVEFQIQGATCPT